MIDRTLKWNAEIAQQTVTDLILEIENLENRIDELKYDLKDKDKLIKNLEETSGDLIIENSQLEERIESLKVDIEEYLDEIEQLRKNKE